MRLFIMSGFYRKRGAKMTKEVASCGQYCERHATQPKGSELGTSRAEVLLADTLNVRVVVVIDPLHVIAGRWLTAEEITAATDIILNTTTKNQEIENDK